MKPVCWLLSAVLLDAASPAAWEMTSYQDFLKGKFAGVALTRDGRVTLAPKLEAVFNADQPAVWSIAQAANDDLWLGTGHQGRLYRVDRAGKSELVFTAPEPEILAVAADSAGRVYAATSPNGKVYRIENGKASEFFAPQARYISALAPALDGSLFVGTGDEGKVFRVSPDGKGELYFETGQSHVTSLALDRQGRLLAGTEPNGILYRITAKDKAFVLLDAALPEIRALAVGSDGSIYAAVMGGSVVRQTAAPAGATPAVSSTVTTTTGTSITVTDASTQGGAEIKPQPAAPAQPQAQTPPTPPSPVVEYAGVEKSNVLVIRPDNSVETLWTSRDENVFDLALSGDSILLATDNLGRLFRLDRDRKAALIAEAQESEAVRLVVGSGGTLVATANLGKVFRLGSTVGASGSFESPVHDATTVARWGRFSWHADSCTGCKLQFRTRTGNSSRPDKTWSDWSEPLAQSDGSQIASPNARFVQWKAELQGSSGGAPILDSVRIAYLPQNTPPAVKSLTVSAQTSAAGAKISAAPAAAAYSITVTDTGETGATSQSGTATQPITRASAEQILITWAAEDADGDKLAYTLEFRGEGETQWKQLRANFTETQFTLDAEALADGRYFFRITASDRAANPAPYARSTDLISAPVLVDRTPPVVRSTRAGSEWRIEVEDTGSPLKSCEYSLDAGAWVPLAPSDGVLDSARESFTLKLEPVPAGEHLLVIRATDSANNAGLVKVILGSEPRP